MVAARSIIEIQYPARGQHLPAQRTFYDGKRLPPAKLFHGETVSRNGSLLIDSRGTLFTRQRHGGSNADNMFLLLPRKEFIDYQLPPQTLPRTQDHYYEFIQACKGGPRTESPIDHASKPTEGSWVGSLALRTGKRIEWDAEQTKADRFILPEFPRGWNI